MKKILNQYSEFSQSFIIIVALILAMLSADGTHTLMEWGALALLWGVTLWSLRKPNNVYAIMKDKAFIGYLLFIVWAIFSSFFLSSVKSVSIIMLMPFVGGLLSYFIAYTSNERKQRYVDWLLLVIGVALVFYTCYQKFALDMSRPIGLMRNWNTHAALLGVILLPWLLRYALKPTVSVWQLIFVSFLSAFFAFAMGLTLSRGALLVLVVSLVGLFLFAARQRLFFKHSLVFVVALIVGYLLNNLFIEDNMMQRLGAVADSNANSLVALGSGRHLLWLPAWQMYLDNPLTGWGLGMFRFLYMGYKSPLSGEAGFFAHNDYLEFLLELGPIGLLLFLGFIGVLVYRLGTLIVKPSADLPVQKNESFIYLVICIGLLVHTFFTFHLYHISMQIIFGYYLGRSARYFQVDQGAVTQEIIPDNQQTFNWLYRSLSAVVIFLTMTFGLSFYYLDKAGKAQNEQEQLDYFWHAGLFFPALERYDSLSAFLMSKQINSGGFDLALRQDVANFSLAQVDAAINKMPFNTRNYITKANILQATQGDMSTISEQYEKALHNEPYLLSVRYEYAQYLVAKQQGSKALKVLWGAWERLNMGYYQQTIEFLTYQLEINKQYGEQQGSEIIEREIQRFTQLKEKQEGGVYVLRKGI